MKPELTDKERAIYEWQISVRGFGEAGQQRLKNSAALVSRCGGLGGPLAQQLVAAGVGKVVIAHAGDVKPSDLHRQILMTDDWLGKPRIDSIVRRLRELNPRVEVVGVPENISEKNVDALVAEVDIVFDCAPLFNERYLMNRACVDQGKPMVECAMFSLTGQLTTIIPGRTPCLACIYPEDPASWKRQFPVFGAVSATAGAMGAMEGIKILAGMESSLAGYMFYYDLETFTTHKIPVARIESCPVCAHCWEART